MKKWNKEEKKKIPENKLTVARMIELENLHV